MIITDADTINNQPINQNMFQPRVVHPCDTVTTKYSQDWLFYNAIEDKVSMFVVGTIYYLYSTYDSPAMFSLSTSGRNINIK